MHMFLHVEDPEITKYTDADIAVDRSYEKSFRPNISKMLDSTCNDTSASTLAHSCRLQTSPAFQSQCALNDGKHSWGTSASTKIPKLKLDGILRPTSTKNEGISSVDGAVLVGTVPLVALDNGTNASKNANSCVHPSGALILSPRTAFDDLSINSEDSSIRSSEKT